MRYVSILILILLASLSAACSDDEGGNPGGLPDKGIVVELSTGQLDTKAHLYSQASLHHVQRVYAVLYHCPEDGSDTTVVASQLLMIPNLGIRRTTNTTTTGRDNRKPKHSNYDCRRWVYSKSPDGL